MRKYLVFLFVISLILSGLALTILAQDVHEAAFVSREGVKLTIYTNNTALVQDTRTFQLETGFNHITFDEVPGGLRPTSVTLTSTDVAANFYIMQQNLLQADNPIDNRNEIMRGNIGETVILYLTTSQDEDVIEGQLVDIIGNSEYVIALEDGSNVIVQSNLVRQAAFPIYPTAERRTNALQMMVNNADAGEYALTLTYLTSGISWNSTDYNLRVAADNQTVDITGWTNLINATDVTFDNADVTLASNFNQVQLVARDAQFAVPTALPTATPTFGGGASGNGGTGGNFGVQATATSLAHTLGGAAEPAPQQPEGISFTLPEPITLEAQQGQMIELLAGAEANARNVYVYDASPRVYGFGGFNTDASYGTTEITTVRNFLEFSTDSENGLGTALPAGRIQIARVRDDGSLILIGQSTLDYTPEDETVQLFLDDTGEISGERRQTEFQILSDDAVQETYEIRLSNRSTELVEITVPERMTRSPNWEIRGSSIPFEQPDPFGVEFMVEVPAGEDILITYSVLYTRPR